MPERYLPAENEAFAALTRFFVEEGTLGDTLHRFADLSCHVAPADMASITLVVEERPTTAVYTDPAAPEIDASQYEEDSGPCIDAFRDAVVYKIDSTLTDSRWPHFCRDAQNHGVLSTLSIPITARETPLGSLNLYARRPENFDDDSVGRVSSFVRDAAIVLVNAQAYWDARHVSENLSNALVNRKTIDHAIGILMASGGRTPDEAFQMLIRASQRENRKLREIAGEIVERAIQRSPQGI